MKILTTALSNAFLIQPSIHWDERGYFYESYNQKEFYELTGIDAKFVQDNFSKSKKGVLRGLHYQLPPVAQGKLIRVIQGAIFDVIVDIRQSSSTFGQWESFVLSQENQLQVWIPPGFAHGYFVLTENAEVFYKTTAYYTPSAARCIIWNDSDINIQWPVEQPPLTSLQDKCGQKLKNSELFF